jgi:hypothetical protein
MTGLTWTICLSSSSSSRIDRMMLPSNMSVILHRFRKEQPGGEGIQ